MNDYPIIDVPRDAANRSEPMGSKRKFWFGPPDEPRKLFKYGRPQHGEDWAEKVAAEIAELLRIPHALIELGTCGGEPGTVTPDFRHGRGMLIHGNELMVAFVDPQYPAGGSTMHVQQHTVANVMKVLETPLFDLPAGLQPEPGIMDAADAFVGYLMLDTLIGNTDRHHENWAIVMRGEGETPSKPAELAPTFDHASSLGRELLDKERQARLDGRDQNRTVERYLAKAECRLFGREEDVKPLSPIAAFQRAGAIRPAASASWRDRLSGIDARAVEPIIARIPADRMSEPARRFALRMLECNRAALLAEDVTPR